MAELLARLLQTPGEWKTPPDLQSSTPPSGISRQDWSLRHELPLHFINFLRDEAEPLLSLAQSSGATPGKTNRPAKYDYNSPLKTVLESPGRQKTVVSDNSKKPKKKVKLFSGKITGKANKSFSDVEEQLELRTNGVNGMEGIGQLPVSPSKNKFTGKKEFKKSQSTSLFSVPENGIEHQVRKFSKSISERRVDETPNSNNHSKQFKKKLSISPQTLSLADFMAPIEGRRNGKKGKTPRSPCKVKSSTPIEDHVVPRLANNISLKINRLDLDSCDSFPEIGEPPPTGGQKKRRMKPTLVSSSLDPGSINPVFGQKVENVSENSDSPFMVEEVEQKSFDSRGMVKEIPSMLTPFKTSGTPTIAVKTPNKTPTLSRSNSIVSTQLMLPVPSQVQKSESLDFMANLYSYIFSHNLMPNFYVELYFVIELLLLDVPQDYERSQKEISTEYLNSIHNCVYFACQVLCKTVKLLAMLDRTTIRLLMDNTRINQFSSDLAETLGDVCDKLHVPSPLMVSRTNRTVTRGQDNISFLTVSFQSETDNRSNFPNNASFHDFKKQRDKFYFLIRKWGENVKGKDNHFETSFGAEVEKVMVMYQHPVNYYHFAKLWVAQLVAMCRGETTVTPETGHLDDTHQLMAELRKTDPVKCKKLAARLVTPGRCGGPCPQPSFSGAAEFFKDFLLVCSSPKFVSHLRDLLVSEVSRLNSVQLDSGDSGGVSRLEDSLGWDTETGVYNEVLVEQFQETIVTLRILAKFLGFLESFPYQQRDTSEELSSDHVTCSVAVRDHVSPALDIAKCVSTASDHGRLVLTLPWVVEFLSQLDQAGHKLPYYNSLYLNLASIYQSKLSPHSLTNQISPLSAHFLSLYLGWLFEKKTFPREVLIMAQISTETRVASNVVALTNDKLDLSEVVTPGLVKQCCPWVTEIRTLLQQWEGGKRGSQLSLDRSEGTYRKITPMAAPLDKKSKHDKESVIQTQLEENFFHNQPKSLRRTVEYVSERLASNIIKKIRQNSVPEEKSIFTEALKDIAKKNSCTDKISSVLSSNVTKYAKDSYSRVMAFTEEQVSTTLNDDCEAALELLLAFDTSKAVKATCVSIGVRTVKEKVWQWVEQQVTLSYFNREYTIEAERVARHVAKDTCQSQVSLFSGHHDPHCIPPSELLILMKSQMKSMLIDQTNVELNSEEVLSVIKKIDTCISSRCDLTQLAVKALESLTLDWMLTLIVKMPEVVSDSVFKTMTKLWKRLKPPHVSNILCPRNLVLFTMSTTPDTSWKTFKEFLQCLIESEILTLSTLQNNFKSLTNLAELNPDLVPLMANVSNILPSFKNHSENQESEPLQ